MLSQIVVFIQASHMCYFTVRYAPKNDFLYIDGRKLAAKVYNRVWKTEYLEDNNDLAIVVIGNQTIMGNVNLQLGKNSTLFRSEVFFEKEHWYAYLPVNRLMFTEVSALAIDVDVSIIERKTILMMLIFGVHYFCNNYGIKYLITVQHRQLASILSKSLKLPLLKNETAHISNENNRRDCYCPKKLSPALYYLDIESEAVVEAIQNFRNCC